MAILLSFAACSNNSASGDGNAGGNPPDSSSSSNSGSLNDTSYNISEGNRLSEEYFDVIPCDDGIYLECDVPGGTVQFRVYIDGIGCVAEEVRCNENKSRGYFFYPFLAPEKKYTVSFVFLREEDFDEDGYCLGHAYGNDAIAWFETEATAGKNSKGEVYIKDFGEIEVNDNGDFKFTKKLTFENEQLLTGSGYDWTLGIGISEGISWLHPNRRSKWLTEIQIPSKEILNKPYNFYTYPRPYGDVTKADFIVWRPKLSYTYKDEVYPYQWDGYTLDTNCKAEDDLWTDIDIIKSADVAKIQGTWTRKTWEGNYDWYDIPCYDVDTETLVIDGSNVKRTVYYTYTKLNGVFTEEELNLFGSNVTVSSDCKTAIEEHVYDDDMPLSEYFEDGSHEHRITSEETSECDRRYKLQLFEDEKTLRIIESHKYDGNSYDYSYDYQKQ